MIKINPDNNVIPVPGQPIYEVRTPLGERLEKLLLPAEECQGGDFYNASAICKLLGILHHRVTKHEVGRWMRKYGYLENRRDRSYMIKFRSNCQ